ncbi:MAG TPA: hypothetical protein VG757_07760 [Devosia sp.]|nr:hypothetical protein [Devosia sp.]
MSVDGRTVVCVTPAGRMRYMRELVPFILSDPAVDRYDIWANTANKVDLAFIEALGEFDKVRVLDRQKLTYEPTHSIYSFFPTACERGTVYIRFDDDVVFVEEGAIGRLAAYRIAHPEYFLVAPIIINNAVVTSLLQARGLLRDLPLVQPCFEDPAGWQNPDFAARLWEQFLSRIEAGTVAELHTADTPLGFNRISINCISWLGEEFAKFDGVVDALEEFDLSVAKPAQLNMQNMLYGGAVVGHFAFYPQRLQMDRSGLLERISAANGRLGYLDHAIRKRVHEIADRITATHPPEPFLRKVLRVAPGRIAERLPWRRPR